jgi:hypothetical protein
MEGFKVGDRVQVRGMSKGNAQDRPFNMSTGIVREVEWLNKESEYLVQHDGNTGKLNEHGGWGVWKAANLKLVTEDQS